MKLAASHIGWREEDDSAVLSAMKGLGYTGLEIAPTRAVGPEPYGKPAEIAVYAGTVGAETGLVLCSMQSIWYGQLGSMFGAERPFLLDYTKAAIRFAAAAAIGNLVFGCPKNRVRPQGATDQDAAEFFRELADCAAQNQTQLSLEPNPPLYGTNFMNTTQEAFAMAALVDSPGCKVNLDFGTLIENKEDPATIVGRVGQIGHVHISEPGLAPIQKREEHKGLARVLREEDYQGYVSLEMKAQPPAVVLEILAYLAEVFG